jgi:regulatory protein
MPPPRRQHRGPVRAGEAPDDASLHQAALGHLARFAATEAGLRRVLERRADRWARRAEAEGMPAETIAAQRGAAKAAAARVAQRMVAAGAVDDAGFAAARAKRLARAGRSHRAIAAHLAAKGVDADLAQAALPEAEIAELDAALAWCRRRRLGPFARQDADDPAARLKALAALARGGFPRAIAQQALDMAPEEAEARLIAARQG